MSFSNDKPVHGIEPRKQLRRHAAVSSPSPIRQLGLALSLAGFGTSGAATWAIMLAGQGSDPALVASLQSAWVVAGSLLAMMVGSILYATGGRSTDTSGRNQDGL